MITTVYAQEPFPLSVTRSIFLAGPSPRKEDDPDWRPAALNALEAEGFDGHVFIPLPRDGVWCDYAGQVQWEEAGLGRADCIAFWCPRNMQSLPGLATNDEWGVHKASGRVVWGSPPDAPHTKYQRYYAEKLGAPVADTLGGTMAAAVKMVGMGALRERGEVLVPLSIWEHPTFASWYASHKAVGNELVDVSVEHVWRVGPKRAFLFAFSAHVTLWVKAEGRNKREYLFGRTDMAAVVLHDRVTPGTPIKSIRVAMVREFRLPARTSDGFIHELPGGSCKDGLVGMGKVIRQEVEEELGLALLPGDLTYAQNRQVSGTLSAHKVHLFFGSLSGEQMDALAKKEAEGVSYGVAADTEKTYPEVRTLDQLLRGSDVDWATMGMILTTICGERAVAELLDEQAAALQPF